MTTFESTELSNSPLVKGVSVCLIVRLHEDGSVTADGSLTPQVMIDGRLVTHDYKRSPAMDMQLRSTLDDLLKSS